MHFYKPEVFFRVAGKACNGVDVVPRALYRVAHRNTICIQLVQPFGLEVAGQGTCG